MGNAIKAMKMTGFSLKNFRHKTKAERSVLWLAVVMHVDMVGWN